jgi:hypothetical protein
VKRLVLLNAFPLSAFLMETFTATFERVPLSRLAEEARGAEIANFIRHPATVECLSEVLGRELKPSAGLYTYRPGDIIYVVSLRQPQRGAEVVSIKVEELDIVRVEVRS